MNLRENSKRLLGPALRARNRVLQLNSSFLRRFEANAKRFNEPNERPIEYAFLFEVVRDFSPTAMLDVGTGTSAVPDLLATCGIQVRAVDNIRDFWPYGMVNYHFNVENVDIASKPFTGEFDMVSCISCLEHVADFDSVVAGMALSLVDDGRLVLTFPYSDDAFVANVYSLPDSEAHGKKLSYITRSFSRVEIERWCLQFGLRVEKQEYWQLYEGGSWSCGRRLPEAIPVSREDLHQLSCVVLVRNPIS